MRNASTQERTRARVGGSPPLLPFSFGPGAATDHSRLAFSPSFLVLCHPHVPTRCHLGRHSARGVRTGTCRGAVTPRRSGCTRPFPRPQEQCRRCVDAAHRQCAGRPEEAHWQVRQRAKTAGRGALDHLRGRCRGHGSSGGRGGCDTAGACAAPGPPPSAHRGARPHGVDLHAHGVRHRRGARGRRRVALLRCAEHAGRASRARHAGHAVSRHAGARRVGAAW